MQNVGSKSAYNCFENHFLSFANLEQFSNKPSHHTICVVICLFSSKVKVHKMFCCLPSDSFSPLVNILLVLLSGSSSRKTDLRLRICCLSWSNVLVSCKKYTPDSPDQGQLSLMICTCLCVVESCVIPNNGFITSKYPSSHNNNFSSDLFRQKPDRLSGNEKFSRYSFHNGQRETQSLNIK